MNQRICDAITKALYFADYGKPVKYVTHYQNEESFNILFEDSSFIILRVVVDK